jgi:hypothetical protein
MNMRSDAPSIPQFGTKPAHPKEALGFVVANLQIPHSQLLVPENGM